MSIFFNWMAEAPPKVPQMFNWAFGDLAREVVSGPVFISMQNIQLF